MGRPQGQTRLNEAGHAPASSVSFSYDPFYPRVVSMTDGTGTTHYSFHPVGVLGANRLAQEVVPTPNATMAYSYDALGRLASRSLDGLTENFQYDNLSRLSQDQNPLGTFAYTHLGETDQVASQESKDSPLRVLYRYESNTDDRRLKAILNLVHGEGHHPQSFIYRTDAENRIRRITITAAGDKGWVDDEPRAWESFRDDHYDQDEKSEKNHEDGESAFHGTSFYAYDDADRLIQAKVHPLGRVDYEHDPADNLLSVSGNKTNFTASYNDLNEISLANGQSFSYDAAGQLINDGERQYTWDAAHRLVSVRDIASGALTQYQYDGLSRRVTITHQANPSATPVTTNYLWCNETLCQARNATNVVLATYYDQGQLNGNSPLYYARNHLGSVMNALDASGKSVVSYTYGPYGRTIAEKTSSGQGADFRYAGMFYDTSTGLYLTHHRAYSPAIRRWLSRDPLGEGGGVNVYAYVFNNPVRWTDPLGLFCTFDFAKHYYTGGGSTIGLGGVGLLGAFQNSASVQSAVNGFKQKVSATAKAKASGLCTNCDKGIKSTSFNLNDTGVTDVTGEPCLFAVGHSTFFRKVGCGVTANCANKTFSFGCSLNFSIRDWFRDPINLGVELPGGTPYRINAGWSDRLTGSGSF